MLASRWNNPDVVVRVDREAAHGSGHPLVRQRLRPQRIRLEERHLRYGRADGDRQSETPSKCQRCVLHVAPPGAPIAPDWRSVPEMTFECYPGSRVPAGVRSEVIRQGGHVPAQITRRDFVSAGLVLPAVFASKVSATGHADITVGITVDTRPDWNGAQNFIRSIDEASAAG